MGKKNLEKLLVKKNEVFCKKNQIEKNINQLNLIRLIEKFLHQQNTFINIFKKSNKKLCFYLYGGVGVGKTMILDFIFRSLKVKKIRFHFNEFMINFHNFRHKNQQDKKSILSYVKKLKKFNLIYLDEFQVTNIVDAMILGKLFEEIFKQKILVFITSNISVDNLYKDGLQRQQFIPFINIIKKNSVLMELSLKDDFRKKGSKKLERLFYPINEKTLFKINKLFREKTKNKKREETTFKLKGRTFIIKEYYEGIARFNFKILCDRNVGSEDYIELTKKCNYIFIENIPKFDEYNSNQQNRFITLIDILYEKNIPLTLTLESNLDNIGSSKKLEGPFKRTLSRLYELTSPNIDS